MKTMLNIKTDVRLKKKAQGIAKKMGLPLSVIMNKYLKEFVEERRIVFADHPMPNAKTQKILKEASEDYRKGRNISPAFTSVKDMDAYLDSLK